MNGPPEMVGRSAETQGGVIYINRDAYRDTSILAREYNRLRDEEKYFPPNTSFRSLMIHEVGHVVDNFHNDVDLLEVARKAMGVEYKYEVFEKLPEVLSVYSAESKKGWEIIAESFASVYGSNGHPTDFALNFMREYDKIIARR